MRSMPYAHFLLLPIHRVIAQKVYFTASNKNSWEVALAEAGLQGIALVVEQASGGEAIRQYSQSLDQQTNGCAHARLHTDCHPYVNELMHAYTHAYRYVHAYLHAHKQGYVPPSSLKNTYFEHQSILHQICVAPFKQSSPDWIQKI